MAVLYDPGSERRVTLPARCLIGRAPDCDLVVREKTVSGQHAVIQWTGNQWELRDLGSRNGTYLDDVKLVPGVAIPLGPRARVRFGRDSLGEVLDVAGPQPMATALATGEVLHADGGYLVLPDADTSELSVYQDAAGNWVVERRGELLPLADRAVLMTADGTRWRIHLPTALAGTLGDDDCAPMVAGLRLCFTVSRDEEHVALVASAGGRRLDLGSRAHHYPLLCLARQRLADQAAGLPESEQGWIRQDELARMLRMDDNHLNISVHRARTQLGRLGVIDAAGLVERRSGSRQLRIGASQLEVTTS